jgi:tellurite resistance protein
VNSSFPSVRPSLFTIPLGLGGLYTCWTITTTIPLPTRLWVGDVLYWPTLGIFVFLLLFWAIRTGRHPKAFIESVKDPVTGSLNSLIPLSGMVVAGGLYSYEPTAGYDLFIVMFCWTIGLGGLWTWYWIRRNSSVTQQYPGNYLPLAAGGFIGAITSVRLGLETLGLVGFCIGIIFWLPIGSVAFRSLESAPTVPHELLPTLAIEFAIPGLAGRAYFGLTDYRIDVISAAFAGYAVLLLLLQIRFLPFYRTVKFSLGYWSFSFPLGTVSAYCIQWLNQLSPPGNSFFELSVLGLITLLIGAIGFRSLMFLIAHK